MKWICQWTKKIEIKFSRKPIWAFLFHLYYQKMVLKEIDLGKISSNDLVLCIGGGPIPATAIEMARLTHAEIVVVDHDPQAVRCARQLIEKLNLSDRISVILNSGDQVPVEKFTVIHIAKQVTPRQLVLNSVFQAAKQGARILVRNPKSFFKSQYTLIDEMFVKQNACAAFNHTDWCSLTYLLVK